MFDLTEYYVPIVLFACLIAGYILKKWIDDIDNKWIPTIVCILGALLNLTVSGMCLESVIYGALTGLASTGLHQVFKQMIEGDGEVE